MITCKEKQEKNSLQVLNMLLSERKHLKKKRKRNLPKCAGVERGLESDMIALDLSLVNLYAPYSVWNVGEYYYFRTAHGAIFKVILN